MFLAKVVVGIISGGSLLTFMGHGIINNDIRNTKDHKEITADYIQRDEKVLGIVQKIETKQAVQTEILKRIEAKL